MLADAIRPVAADPVAAARAALRAAPALPAAACPVTAMVAAARAKVALAGPTGWDAILETRNLLTDFVNARMAQGTETAALKPAEDLADELERNIQNSACPARVQIAHALRLNREGFDMSGFMAGLLADVASEVEQPSAPPRFDDAEAVARWDMVASAFQTAMAESDKACDLEGEEDDNDRLKALYARHEAVHQGWRICKETLLATPAPHWDALSLKATVLARYADSARWVRAATDFAEAAEEIGKVKPAEADLLAVMKARGHAEQIAYYAAKRPDGYADFACGLGQVASLVTEIEGIVKESRDLARVNPRHAAMSGEIISAVWFNQVRGERLGGVDALDDEFSGVVRTYQTLDEKNVSKEGLTPEEHARFERAGARLDEIREAAFAEPPMTRSGMAFQLLVAASMVDRCEAGSTEEIRLSAAENIRTTLANAIRVMGLPFDYRAAQYFMGPQMDDLDGRDRGGPVR